MAIRTGTGIATVQNAAGQFASKTITFTGAAGAGAVGTVAIFTVAGGLVSIDDIIGRVTTSLTGATATMILGTASQTSIFAASIVATTLTTAAPLWVAATAATAGSLLIPAAAAQGVYTYESVIITVGTAAVASGVLEIDCIWHPLTAGATLV